MSIDYLQIVQQDSLDNIIPSSELKLKIVPKTCTIDGILYSFQQIFFLDDENIVFEGIVHPMVAKKNNR